MKDLSNENVIQINKDGVSYLQFKRLLDYSDKIEHCFTLKNITFGDNSNFFQIENLAMDNYKKICNALNLDYKNVVRPFQTHTSCVKSVTTEKGIFIDELQDVDGLITNQKNEILSLTFADCTPVFLYDYENNIIGNIHSGWKGTVGKIAGVAVKKMISDYKSNPEHIIACIGPTIRKCHFEVEEDVKDMFFNSYKDEEIITKGDIKNGVQKYYIDTVLANTKLLKSLGLKDENIIDSKICTVCNSDLMHSYRADGIHAGRNTSLMCIK